MVEESKEKFSQTFEQRYKKEFGFTLDREILIDDVRVRAYGKTRIIPSTTEATPLLGRAVGSNGSLCVMVS